MKLLQKWYSFHGFVMRFESFGQKKGRPNDSNYNKWEQQVVILDQIAVQNGIKICLGVPPRRVREPSRKKEAKGRERVVLKVDSWTRKSRVLIMLTSFVLCFFEVVDWFFNVFLVDFSTIRVSIWSRVYQLCMLFLRSDDFLKTLLFHVFYIVLQCFLRLWPSRKSMYFQYVSHFFCFDCLHRIFIDFWTYV